MEISCLRPLSLISHRRTNNNDKIQSILPSFIIFFESFDFLKKKMSVIDKNYREQCWKNRDDYWKCLDKNDEDKEKCLKYRQLFESSCPATWVTHFDQRREYDIFKRQLAAGQIETDKLKSLKDEQKKS